MPSRRDTGAAAAATGVVLAALVAGFVSLGGPSTQRLIQLDNKRVENLQSIEQAIRYYYQSKKKLPDSIDSAFAAEVQPRDPQTRSKYEYSHPDMNTFLLCATFSASRQSDGPGYHTPLWDHPAGHYCYSFTTTLVN